MNFKIIKELKSILTTDYTYQLRRRHRSGNYKPLYLHNMNKNTRMVVIDIQNMIDYIIKYDSNLVQPYVVPDDNTEYEILKEFKFENEEQLRMEFLEYLI